MKFAYVTNDTAETSITKNRTTPRGTVICDSDGVTGDHISHQEEKYCFNKLFAFFF
jgi:hypothetical protein